MSKGEIVDKQLFELANNTTKGCFVLNAGAIIAIMTFLNDSGSLSPETIDAINKAIRIWIIGIAILGITQISRWFGNTLMYTADKIPKEGKKHIPIFRTISLATIEKTTCISFALFLYGIFLCSHELFKK